MSESKNQDQHILAWKKTIYVNAHDIDPHDELCWRSLAIGFFMARGLSAKQAEAKYNECVKLGCF